MSEYGQLTETSSPEAETKRPERGYYLVPSTLIQPRMLSVIDVVDMDNGELMILEFTPDLSLRMTDYFAVSKTHPHLMELILSNRRLARETTRFELHDVIRWGVDTQNKIELFAARHGAYPMKEEWIAKASQLCKQVDDFLMNHDRVENIGV